MSRDRERERRMVARTSHEWFVQYMEKLDELGSPWPSTLRQAPFGSEPQGRRQGGQAKEDLLELIQQGWDRIRPGLQKDPDELARRLARRRGGMMNRPPRAWCLAIRAADSRINSGSAVIVPEAAGYPRECLGPNVRPLLEEHEVTLTAKLVRKLCSPVYTYRPYSTVPQLMKQLGCSLHNIRAAMRKGVFDVRTIPGLEGKRGRPVPVLFNREPLDPGSRLRKHADPVWGTMWRYVSDHVPDELRQTIKRVPERSGAVLKGMDYTGWKWICPGCGGRCRTIFYPLPPLVWVQLLKREFHRSDPLHPDALQRGNGTFACMKCHQVLYFSRLGYRQWNHLISHLSAGLMYGHEVRRPAWYVQERKRAFHPILRREPSKRRAEVLEMLIKGMGVTDIAIRLGLSKSAVGTYASQVYRQHGVRNVSELRKLVRRRAREKAVESEGDVRSVDIGSERAVFADDELVDAENRDKIGGAAPERRVCG